MANYSAIKAAVNAYIKANGKKEITGHILNSVLNATIDSLGRYFQFAGGAMPTDNPGTPDQNVCYLAGVPGVYTNFGGITVENEEVALLFWDGEWTKQRVLLGIQEVEASVDNQVGTPSVDVSYSGGQLVLTFHNLKGEQGIQGIQGIQGEQGVQGVQGVKGDTGAAAGFGTIGADINGGVGTPGVSVESSGDNTAKNLMFHFTNLKGDTGVTSVVATIDDTSGTPSCQVSLVNGVLTLAFSGLKGLKGDTGVSADYPITIYNGLDSDATDQALAAAQGKVLDGKISQLGQEVDENTNFIEPGGTDTLALYIGIIGVNDGVVYPNSGGGKGLYSDAHSAVPGQVFTMSNPNSHGIVWHRAHFYMGATYVRYVELGATINNYTAPEANDYDTIRFCFWSNDNFTTSDIIITTPSEDVYTPVKDVVESNEQRITALESIENDTNTSVNEINNGYRVPTDADFTQSIDGHFKIENGSLYGKKAGSDPAVMMVFNDGIKAIEFEFASLWDSNLISLVFGIGVDTGNDKPCFATAYMNTSARPNEIGAVVNKGYDGSVSAAQSSSLYGQGHFSGDYRQSQVKPYAVAVGDKCRIELIDGHFFKASVYNTTSGCWDFWWCLDTDGSWSNPKMGWTTRRAIGFGITFAAITNWKELVKNIRIVSEEGKTSGIYSELSNDFPERKQWVAIGDSITEIDKNNGLSYVGYAQRKLGYKVNNQGKGGWTIYKLWRDRATAGWEDAVSAINDGDLVTILAGTNDFDTANFSTPVSDEAMDAAGSPHPRFGTTDPTSEDAKDPHTTLGCLRLMIERILTLKPGARLSVFSPFYREKGRAVGQTSWEKLYINSDGHTIYDYSDAIYSVAREYNLPAYNTCRDCGINAMTLAAYTYDDLHIGQVGGELIGDYVAKRIS